MHNLATSVAADPSLSVQQENDNRLAMESGTAAFELNYPFVYPSMKSNKPDLFKNFKWAPYPAVAAGQATHVTIGGINLAVGAYSKHPDLAFAATLCLRNRANQLIGAIKGGVPPSIADLYDDPALQADYPFADIKASLAHRRRPASDPRLPEHLDRHLPLGVPAGLDQSRQHGEDHGQPDHRRPQLEGTGAMSTDTQTLAAEPVPVPATKKGNRRCPRARRPSASWAAALRPGGDHDARGDRLPDPLRASGCR